MPIISRLPALISLELICPELPVYWNVASLLRTLLDINPTNNDSDDGSISPSSTPNPRQISNFPNIGRSQFAPTSVTALVVEAYLSEHETLSPRHYGRPMYSSPL